MFRMIYSQVDVLMVDVQWIPLEETIRNNLKLTASRLSSTSRPPARPWIELLAPERRIQTRIPAKTRSIKANIKVNQLLCLLQVHAASLTPQRPVKHIKRQPTDTSSPSGHLVPPINILSKSAI
ncbi:hypothetical protein H112_08277 [Trichophyton rubrum D6]|uniref:Uncharacterized protein n=3 Tax=Trichophyton TaxID=5550 RepID=A0A080WQB1_TRIRC|nr:uncharacterized protein TERG_11643 [Trichophyton rubrum CBS 118892]EZF10456.1 hypothetical protein H100_08300 [Trichophyton rubrum MR850]EZF37308.1 hypothetical protein H102_08259 [Trichophyton rubrum CBS 100081]EZF47932.1 hypothetical protein H103_08282 [Trichophyton rubrum CBS 288.86]EZF58555.1 hypothetical protein H104_08233 [Trichophyton rubrum CBS 289.86]EZF69229.1 hypothetical protein H105_08287 [Trichophyton soudanense CBS 452.61]EZF79935.1 hypothetical protein H110_08281 [Trichophy